MLGAKRNPSSSALVGCRLDWQHWSSFSVDLAVGPEVFASLCFCVDKQCLTALGVPLGEAGKDSSTHL